MKTAWRMPALLLAAVLVPVLFGRWFPGTLNAPRAGDLTLAASFSVAALALNLLMGYAGQISLGHFALVGVGAFSCGLATNPLKGDLPFVWAVILAAGAGGLMALLVGLPALRLRGVSLAIVTIGLAYACEQSIFRIKSITGGSGGLTMPRPYFGSFSLAKEGDFLGLALALLVLVWWLDTNVTSTKLGRAFQAIRADENVAAAYGVDVTRYKLLAYTVSGAMAGIAGAIYGTFSGTVSSDSFPFAQSLSLVVIVVVGGLGSRTGVIVSAIAFSLLPKIIGSIIGQNLAGYDILVGALILMATVAKNPGGIAQIIRETREHRHAKQVSSGEVEEPPLPGIPDLPRPEGLPERPTLAAGQPVLSVTDVRVSFGGLQAVDGASLAVPRGSIVGLIGPNGAGKSTLFNVISGLQPSDTGRVEFMGQDVTSLPAHRRSALGIGRTFQLIGLAKELTVTENLLLAQHNVAGYSIPEALVRLPRSWKVERSLRERAAAAVAALDFERYADTPVRNLSHGQQRIVEIGATLVTAPELVMLDEPSAGMSPGAAEALAVRLRDMRDQLGRTVLIIEHNLPLVLDVCDELYVLDAGKVIASGDPREVASNPEVVSAYLGIAVPA